MAEPTPKSTRSYPEILQLNQELVRSLQGLSDEDEARKKELDQAKADIARLQEELRRSKERALDAHLNAMHSAIERYLQQGRKAA
jgi:predicted nuclease with TOPRIM domain